MNLFDPKTVQSLLEEAVTLVSIYGLNLLISIGIFFVGRMAANKIAGLARALMLKARVDDTLRSFLRNVIYYALLAAVVVMALGQAGLNVTSFLAVLGAAGLAVGLALKDSLSNFAAGVMLIMLKFFRRGDWVSVAGESGTVQTVSIFNTILTTADNRMVIVPNAAILSGTIVNVTANDTRRVDLVMGIGYGDDLLKAKELLMKILTDDPRVLTMPAPQVEVLELAESSVNFAVRPWVKTPDYWGVYFGITEKVKLVFDQEGISIPFPQRDVHVYPVEKQN
ncbi:MAG: mechanosensitive ion channel [Pseudodesulfovibrio sp.]|uniref:MscS Mechanosensitive ion channel n=1 Tax=Pseudodesulfovibrio aespoeensis (strain ATCC 700646 / DSM 10631 / Aspo-2) TaxID=643562 RepID=E6VTR0_PSEA9|nr:MULTISPECIES: mechanosensitive ion channel domain-containing protein [Pseudodesulfovibrio]MBU4192829.1 mechanosensitive ion channel [Pseudomonadota bacterium]ADU63347.1 MscS Mechanosensitive ion channel [Pseudodesulfovibrio aespoeensis Aspo-2]MBU4245235.1 mechanosensitive ion channel [Pseudomonadota bacterium]MBU4380018.1 mechanosensitive ion channel [Pseudomonadota bacterium]MBU4476020.1 mechanosensitive ion channel [Pseudomonadota bacterium]